MEVGNAHGLLLRAGKVGTRVEAGEVVGQYPVPHPAPEIARSYPKLDWP